MFILIRVESMKALDPVHLKVWVPDPGTKKFQVWSFI